MHYLKINLMQVSTDGTCMCMLLSAAYVYTYLYEVCDVDLIPALHCIILHIHCMRTQESKKRSAYSSAVQEHSPDNPGWWVNIHMESMHTHLRCMVLMTVGCHRLLNLVQYQVKRTKSDSTKIATAVVHCE